MLGIMIWCHLQLSLLSVIYKCIKFSLKFTKPYDLKVRGPLYTYPATAAVRTYKDTTNREETDISLLFFR